MIFRGIKMIQITFSELNENKKLLISYNLDVIKKFLTVCVL